MRKCTTLCAYDLKTTRTNKSFTQHPKNMNDVHHHNSKSHFFSHGCYSSGALLSSSELIDMKLTHKATLFIIAWLAIYALGYWYYFSLISTPSIPKDENGSNKAWPAEALHSVKSESSGGADTGHNVLLGEVKQQALQQEEELDMSHDCESLWISRVVTKTGVVIAVRDEPLKIVMRLVSNLFDELEVYN